MEKQNLRLLYLSINSELVNILVANCISKITAVICQPTCSSRTLLPLHHEVYVPII